VQYLEDVCRKYQIVDKIQFDTAVSEARWLDDVDGGVWEVTLTHLRHGLGDMGAEQRDAFVRAHGAENAFVRTEKVRAKVLVSAVGGLVEPRAWPRDWPSRDRFAGPVFHSARWDASVDLAGKHVLVVGTGCSAAQFVPRLTQPPCNARAVTQLMRSPPWVMPRMPPPFGEEAWGRWAPEVLGRVPLLARVCRALLFLLLEYDWRLFGDSAFSVRERRKVTPLHATPHKQIMRRSV
jgi:cation diffusion facilitator CzcD-associated flavoprotein CzcO